MRSFVLSIVFVTLTATAPLHAYQYLFVGPPDAPGEYWGDHHNRRGSNPFSPFSPWMTERDVDMLVALADGNDTTRELMMQVVQPHVAEIDRQIERTRTLEESGAFWTDEEADLQHQSTLNMFWLNQRDEVNAQLRATLPDDRKDLVDRYARMRADEERWLMHISDHPLLVLGKVAEYPEPGSVLEQLVLQLEREFAVGVQRIADAEYVDISWDGWDLREEAQRKLELAIEIRRLVMTWAERIAKQLDEQTATRFIRELRYTQFHVDWRDSTFYTGGGKTEHIRTRVLRAYDDLPEMIDLLNATDELLREQWDAIPGFRLQIDDATIALLQAEELHGREHETAIRAERAIRVIYSEYTANHRTVLLAYIDAGLIARADSPSDRLFINIPQPGYQAHQQRELILGIPNEIPNPDETTKPDNAH